MSVASRPVLRFGVIPSKQRRSNAEALLKIELISLAVVIAGLLGSDAGLAATPSSDERQYLNALSLNDQGRGQEALPLLEELTSRQPGVLRYRYDYVAVASASGAHATALAAVDAAAEGGVPSYVLTALYRSALAVDDETRSERLNALARDRFGADIASDIGLGHLYLRLGHYDKALALSGRLLASDPQRHDVLELRAYALRQSGLQGEALLVYLDIQKHFPGDADAAKAIGMILVDLGSPRLASQRLEAAKVGLGADETLRLRKDQGAQHIAWSDGDPVAAQEHFRNVDAAIAMLEAARAEALAGEATPAMRAAIRGNLIVAYHARDRWPDALAEYAALQAAGDPIADEVLRVVASSYAALGRFAEAEPILRGLVERTPDSYEATLAWINVLVDLERFDEAEQLCADLVARLARTDRSNPAKAAAYTSARLAQAMLPGYRGRNAEALRRLAQLQDEAPGSLDVSEAIGIVAGWRGQPRLAEEQFRIVLGEQPERIESRLGLANARLDRGEVDPLRQRVAELSPAYAAQVSVRDAASRVELHDDYYVVADTTFGGDQNDVADNRTLEFGVKAYSRPLGDGHWRAFAHERYQASGPVIDNTANAFSGGVQYRSVDWTTEVEGGSAGYARFETTHAFSDQWSASLALENDVFFRPSQAVANGVSADRAALGANWRRDDDFELGGGYVQTDFSDNQRSEAFVAVNQYLYRDFDRRLSVAARVYGQRNSDSDVSYFSPSQQLEVSATLTFELRQWQDVATKKSSLWHRFWVTAGEVNQQGFGNHSMSSVGYGQEIALTDRFRLRWSIASTRFPYDGVKSSYYTGNIGFEGYF